MQLAASHTWFPFLPCLWHLGSAQGSSCSAPRLVPLPKPRLLIPALSPIPASGIFAHPWRAEYSFPPCLIAVNTNSSSFFRLLRAFRCLPNRSHSLAPLRAAPPQKAIRSAPRPRLPTQLFLRGRALRSPSCLQQGQPPSSSCRQPTNECLQSNRQSGPSLLQGDCSSLRWHRVFQRDVSQLARLRSAARLQTHVQSSEILAAGCSRVVFFYLFSRFEV